MEVKHYFSVMSLGILSLCYVVSPCTVSSEMQGLWSVYQTTDGISFNYEFNVTISSDFMHGFRLDQFPNLLYYCYDRTGNRITFKSEETLFFDTYEVHIFLCWNMYLMEPGTFYVKELTDPVMYNSLEHAKAYLMSDNTLPDTENVCEAVISGEGGPVPPFKKLKRDIFPTWEN